MRMHAFALLLATVAQSGFALSVKEASIQDLKTEIQKIASENQARTDNYPAVRAQLEPLVKELVDRTNQSAEERLTGKYGTWQQLWTDDADDTRPNNFLTRIDRTRTFQVVDPKGFFYNVSEMETAINLRLTVFLRGEYQKEGSGVGIKFTNLDIKVLGIRDVEEITYKLENKQEKFFPATKFSQYPSRGPVGAEGFIDTVYVDDELRIDYGFNKADKVVDLFVLKRL
jgi:hypothetical protein